MEVEEAIDGEAITSLKFKFKELGLRGGNAGEIVTFGQTLKKMKMKMKTELVFISSRSLTGPN
jgi:hypothetical protein